MLKMKCLKYKKLLEILNTNNKNKRNNETTWLYKWGYDSLAGGLIHYTRGGGAFSLEILFSRGFQLYELQIQIVPNIPQFPFISFVFRG